MGMVFRSLLRLRRPQRAGKLFLFVVAALSISFLFIKSFEDNKQNASVVIENLNVTWTSDAVVNATADLSLNVYVWRELCGSNVQAVKQIPTFPNYPDQKGFINDVFEVSDNKEYYGQLIFGFLKPPTSGPYRFAIASDDSSELWLSESEDPNEKRLICRVYDEKEGYGWTKKRELNKYPVQMSQFLNLRRGNRYYIEVLHKQGVGDGFAQVYWSTPSEGEFQLIPVENFERYSKDSVVLAKKDAYHQAFANHYRSQYEMKANIASGQTLQFYSLPLIPKANYLPLCEYKSSAVWNSVWNTSVIGKYESQKLLYYSNVYPPDDTSMGDTGMVRRWPNPAADRDIVVAVVNKMVGSLRRYTTKEYFLQRIHKVIHKPDPVYGDRFSLDVEVGLERSKTSFRLSEHVFIKTGSGQLCFQEGMNWKSNATVYFILPVRNQGKWVYHFINELSIASSLTKDVNFHVVVVDFESRDIDLEKAFNTSLLRDRHTLVKMKGKFYKTLALNEGVARVPSEYDLVFLFDLHIDVPVDIIDSVRKNTIEGRVAFYPVVGRLDCGKSSVDHQGVWADDGFGLFAMYKSDWNRIGGMNVEKFKYKWGGEDWEFLDRVVKSKLEVERFKYPGLYHHFHLKQGMWNLEPTASPPPA